MIQNDRTRRRRKLYKRSNTLATLPTHLIPEVDQEHDDEESTNEQSRLIKSTGSPTHSLESSSEMERSDDELRPLNLKIPQQQAASRQKKSPRSSAKHGRSSSGSDMPPMPTFRQSGPPKAGRHPEKKLLRTPSTPAILLNKVKDRIREKVFQTSSEWPTAAAIMQEKRQRAVENFEARLSKGGRNSAGDELGLEQIQLRELQSSATGQGKKDRNRGKSEPGPSTSPGAETFRPDMARLAFRRRSISEDTGMQNIGRVSPRGSMTSTLRPISKTGVVCSNDDLKAILGEHKRRLSPNPIHRSPRLSPTARSRERLSLSDDTSPVRNKLESQGSIDSSSSSFSSRSHSRIEEADLYPVVGKQTDHVQISPRTSCSEYPNIVLDNKSKVTIFQPYMVTTDEEGNKEKGGPVKEVEYDELGQTWDVYGAEFDPEMLGEAIQKHLENMIARKIQEEQILSQQREHRKMDEKKRREDDSTLAIFFRLLCHFARRREHEMAS